MSKEIAVCSQPQFKHVQLFFREETASVKLWGEKLHQWINNNYPDIHILEPNSVPLKGGASPELLIILGGDGTILEAARAFYPLSPLIFGLNLGTVGFLASVRIESDFFTGMEKVFSGNYQITQRMMIRGSVKRNGHTIFSSDALNEIAVKNLISMVEVDVAIDGYLIRKVRGDGVLVSTATGSTAYNLSAHGPVIMPNIKCFIITELLNHNIPTSPLVVKWNREVTLTVKSFRKIDKLCPTDSSSFPNVVFTADFHDFLDIEKGDKITIKKSPRLARFVELESSYFFRSLQEKFRFN